MTTWIQELVDSYSKWLKQEISFRDIGGIAEITTPFLDRHNDHIQLFVQKEDGKLRISDDGYTISDLVQSGCSLDTPSRQAMLRVILSGFGVTRSPNDELICIARNGDFPQRKHLLIQAVLAVGDLFATAKSHVASLFLEDVSAFLDKIDARNIAGASFQGRSHLTHYFDFVIPKSNNAPERFLKAVNRPSRAEAGSLIFAWTDTQPDRMETSTLYAVLNDAERSVPPDVVDAFEQYGINPITWSQRSDFTGKLVA